MNTENITGVRRVDLNTVLYSGSAYQSQGSSAAVHWINGKYNPLEVHVHGKYNPLEVHDKYNPLEVHKYNPLEVSNPIYIYVCLAILT